MKLLTYSAARRQRRFSMRGLISRIAASLTIVFLLAPAILADTVVYVALAAEKKIAVYRMNPEDGKLSRIDATVLDGEPGALAVDPNRRFLFASLRAKGKLAAFRIDAKTGKLTHVNTVPAGPDPAHLSTDKDGKYLLCAYYVAAKVTVASPRTVRSAERRTRASTPRRKRMRSSLIHRIDSPLCHIPGRMPFFSSSSMPREVN